MAVSPEIGPPQPIGDSLTRLREAILSAIATGTFRDRVCLARITASGQARTFDFQAGDVGFVPFAMGHCVENTGTTPPRFLEVFKEQR
jgi:hypothetical protein